MSARDDAMSSSSSTTRIRLRALATGLIVAQVRVESSVGGGERKLQDEARAPTWAAVDADLSLVGLDDPARDEQPQAEAADARGRAAPLEALEDRRLPLGADPRALVLHGD